MCVCDCYLVQIFFSVQTDLLDIVDTDMQREIFILPGAPRPANQ